MKVGLERVGEPSELRSGVSFWRESPSSRVAFLFTREAIRLTRSRGCRTRWPLPVRSWGAPPVERGACSGFSAGAVSVAVVSVVEVSGAAGSAAVVSRRGRRGCLRLRGLWCRSGLSRDGGGGGGRRRHRGGLRAGADLHGRRLSRLSLCGDGDRERGERGGHGRQHRQHGHGQLHGRCEQASDSAPGGPRVEGWFSALRSQVWGSDERHRRHAAARAMDAGIKSLYRPARARTSVARCSP